jgi:hypothetical protein
MKVIFLATFLLIISVAQAIPFIPEGAVGGLGRDAGTAVAGVGAGGVGAGVGVTAVAGNHGHHNSATSVYAGPYFCVWTFILCMNFWF